MHGEHLGMDTCILRCRMPGCQPSYHHPGCHCSPVGIGKSIQKGVLHAARPPNDWWEQLCRIPPWKEWGGVHTTPMVNTLCKIWRASENKSKYRDPQQQSAVDSSEPSWSPETLWRFIVKHPWFYETHCNKMFWSVHGWSQQVGKIVVQLCFLLFSISPNRVEFRAWISQLHSESDPWDWYIYLRLGQLSGINVGNYTMFLMDPPWDLKQPIENQITIRKRLKMLGIYENWHPMSCLANIKVKMLGRRCDVLIPIYGITW